MDSQIKDTLVQRDQYKKKYELLERQIEIQNAQPV